jgi:hypothetical protein
MKEYLDSDEKIKKLKKIVDEACERIKSGELTLGEAKKEAALVRLKAESLIPDDMEKFDLIYGNRFKRLIQQFVEKKRDNEGKSSSTTPQSE